MATIRLRAAAHRRGGRWWTGLWLALAALGLRPATAETAPAENAPPPATAAPEAASATAPAMLDLTGEDNRSYRVDPGDVIEVVIPRYPEYTKQYILSPEGNITFPLLGVLAINGLTPPEIERLLAEQLGPYLRYPAGIQVRVLAKQMMIRISGHVGSPGLRMAPKEANIQEVLNMAGGVQSGGKVTQILLRRRQGDWIEETPVDLKSFIEGHGELPQLQSGDELFVARAETIGEIQGSLVPQLSPAGMKEGTVQVLGAVGRPGLVMLEDDPTLLATLTSAGGWTADADLRHIKRMPGGEGEAVEMNLQDYLDHGGTLPRVSPGDVITVPRLMQATIGVRVAGAVAQPGPQQVPRQADLQTILLLAGGPLPTGDTKRIQVIRQQGGEVARFEFDLDSYMRGADPAAMPGLEDGDVVFVPKGAVMAEAPAATVYVFGHVGRPGPYPLVEQRSLIYALAQAGGALPTANTAKIKITRAGGPPDQRTTLFDLQGFQDGKVPELPPLSDGDVITVDPNEVTVIGAVRTPGPVEVKMRSSLMQALLAAGGPDENADLSRVTITRSGADGPERIPVNIEQYLYEPEEAPPMPLVQGGDVVSVEAGTVDSQLAYVVGAVQRPGVVTVPGRRASIMYVLTQAGGVTPTADREQVRIIRPTADGIQTDLFDLKELQDGRMSGTMPEIHPGDVVSVDELGKPGRGVLVLGAVGHQGRVLVEEKGQTVIDTIGLVGGASPNADISKVRLIRGDTGEVITINLADFSQRGVPTPEVRDGDVLVVGPRREVGGIFNEVLKILTLRGLFGL